MSHKCLYCGNDPVVHSLTWLNESFGVFITPFDRRVTRTRFYSSMAWFLDVTVFHILFAILKFVGIVSYNVDPEKIISSRGKVLWEEAKRRGIPIKSIQAFGREIDAYEARVRETTIRFQGLPRPREKHGVVDWIDDKLLLKERLASHGIPVSLGKSFTRYGPIEKYFDELEKPVVIKPQLGSRGRHTTTFIHTKQDLRKAFDIAKRICHWVVLEEHLRGNVYRGTVIGGKLVAVLSGEPPRITGDGHSTIRALIEEKNRTKPEGVKDFVVTPLTPAFLARSKGYSLFAVPHKDEIVDLSEKIGVRYGGVSEDVTDETHEDIRQIIEKAAHVIDDPIIGFDFIVPDIARSPHAQKWGIIECNTLPFINLHHDPLRGKTLNVAQYIWDLWEKRS